MSFKEVQDCFFEYEDKRHKILLETQHFFLKRGYQPYVWFDEQHRLRVKHKYKRNIQDFTINKENKERCDLLNIAKEFSEQNNLTMRFIFDFCETDRALSKNVQSQWSTELIFEV